MFLFRITRLLLFTYILKNINNNHNWSKYIFTYLIALQDDILEPTSTIPWHTKFPIVILAFPLKNPYLNPVIGNNERFVISPISDNQPRIGGVASQLQDRSPAECWQFPCFPHEHWKLVWSLPLISSHDATCFKWVT